MSSQTKNNRIGKILIGIMAIDIVIIFILPIFSNFKDIPDIIYKELFFMELSMKYPLQLITYLLPYIGIIYLATKTPKKIIKYIIGWCTMIFISIIIAGKINNISVLNKYKYEYLKCIDSTGFENIETGYNFLNFVKGK